MASVPIEHPVSSNDANAALRLSHAQAHTRHIARGNRENFIVASFLLPRRLRQPFYDVYAFCRTADDFADQSSSPLVATSALSNYRESVRRMFAREAIEDPLFLALAATVDQFGLTRQPFDDLLDAFVRDQEQTRYETREDLLDYCRCSANPVGRMVLQLAGCDTPDNASLSDLICTGLQLANFWQDIARDHLMGRIYLPHQTMREYEFDESLIERTLQRQDTTPPPVRRAVSDSCDWARDFFERGLPLADRVPSWLAADIRLFAHGGLATLDAIAAIDFDVLRHRPTVSRRRRLAMLFRAMVRRL